MGTAFKEHVKLQYLVFNSFFPEIQALNYSSVTYSCYVFYFKSYNFIFTKINPNTLTPVVQPVSSNTGRTGTMVCTWLIDSDQFESAKVKNLVFLI